MATIVIGDVHGCLDELLALIALCAPSADDRVVLVGDLVAKGPDSVGVVRWARESGAGAVLGNHDAHVLRLIRGGTGSDPARSPKPEHERVAAALDTADVDWLAARPLSLRFDGGSGANEHLVVHAGLVPGVPLEHQARDHLLNLRSITSDGQPSKRLDGAPWASLWRGPEHVVFGHDAVRGLQRYSLATGLDTGCVYGKRLTALVLPEGDIVSVAAKRAYTPGKAKL